MAVGDLMQITIVGQWGAAAIEIVNTLHYVQRNGADNLTPDQMKAFCDAVWADLSTDFLGTTMTSYGLSYMNARGITGGVTGLSVDSFTNTGAAGTHVIDAGPVERCFLVQKKTGFAGRGGHGWMYLPPAPLLNFTDIGELAPVDLSGAYGSALALCVDLTDPITDANGNLWDDVLYNRSTNVVTTITSCTVRQIVGIQRRRRLGFGA